MCLPLWHLGTFLGPTRSHTQKYTQLQVTFHHWLISKLNRGKKTESFHSSVSKIDNRSESKVLQYFVNARHKFNSSGSFLSNPCSWRTTEDLELPSSFDTLRVLPTKLASITWITASKSTLLGQLITCLIVVVLATRAKFLEASDYCTFA